MIKNKKFPAWIFWGLVISIPIAGFGQRNDLLKFKQYFDRDLKGWTNSFYHFRLADFRIADTIAFSHDQRKGFNNYTDFLSVYKPILTYSADSSQFIDIYSVPLNIQKKNGYYVANPGDRQGIYLCNLENHSWSIIYSRRMGGGIDEVIWITKTKFILVGIEYATNGPQSLPVIILGDTDLQRLERYTSPDESCFQDIQGYQSPKLMKMNIKNL